MTMISRKRSAPNPITAVTGWIATVAPPDPVLVKGLAEVETWRDGLLHDAPKRYSVYPPMALLPAGSFSRPAWAAELARHNSDTLATLWLAILQALSRDMKVSLTHLAVNEAIPPKAAEGIAANVRRSPSGLRLLYGYFGPAEVPATLSVEDFDQALWASTKQNGLTQTWAPRWTMFSRGNVKEKIRLLAFPRAEKQVRDTWAVDLYAGIGYFAFCYASLGFRVLCWEVNPWSVEGLRRGALANGWTVNVVHGAQLEEAMEHAKIEEAQITIFHENNEQALWRVQALQRLGKARDIRHINCGLLPTSEPMRRPAWEMTRLSAESWLHLHENVGVNDIEARKLDIQGRIEKWDGGEAVGRSSRVHHVEMVKTFAPDVWHCVFDVYTTRNTDT